MAENSTVARPYAQALFEAVAGDASVLNDCVEELKLLSDIVTTPEVQLVLSNPQIEDQQRLEVLTVLLQGRNQTAAMRNFVPLLLENDRLTLLPEIAHQVMELRDAALGVAQAHIVSAFPMDEAQIADLLKVLEPKFKIKLTPHVTVDPSLIGGVRVVVQDHVLDTSVQAQLNSMRDALIA